MRFLATARNDKKEHETHLHHAKNPHQRHYFLAKTREKQKYYRHRKWQNPIYFSFGLSHKSHYNRFIFIVLQS